jgi:hypothetical protein
MEPTITQNSALYLAYHKASKSRATLFRRLTAGSKQGPDAQRQLSSRGLIHRPTTLSGQWALSRLIHSQNESPTFASSRTEKATLPQSDVWERGGGNPGTKLQQLNMSQTRRHRKAR